MEWDILFGVFFHGLPLRIVSHMCLLSLPQISRNVSSYFVKLLVDVGYGDQLGWRFVFFADPMARWDFFGPQTWTWNWNWLEMTSASLLIVR